MAEVDNLDKYVEDYSLNFETKIPTNVAAEVETIQVCNEIELQKREVEFRTYMNEQVEVHKRNRGCAIR